MKLLLPLCLLTLAVSVNTLQSCSFTGNNGSKQTTGLHVVSDSITYMSEIQSDSNNRMVSLTNYLHPLSTDFRYATAQNFTKKVLYHNPEAFLRLPAARALQAVQDELKQQDLAIKIFDAYRPYSVTVEMWKIVPDERYAANPTKGSGHNRGVAVDLTLVNLTTGEEIAMPTDFDDFSEKAHHDYMKLGPRVITNRKFLRNIMEKHGFVALETEWWHYYLPNANYSLLDFDFEQLRRFSEKL